MTALTFSLSSVRSDRLAAALFALTFGAFLVFGVGFAGSAEIHNAAHDARHAFAFPCH